VSTLGYPRLHLRRTDSTNDRARELALAGAPHGTLVTAAEQSAGRGRQGRRWTAPPGSALLMSLLVRPPPSLLPMIVAVAVCDVAGEDARIKWPNDVVVEAAPRAVTAPYSEGRPEAGPQPNLEGQLAKLAGILIEGRPQEGWAVLGIGLNVAVELDRLPAELRPGGAGRSATSPLPAATLGRPREAIEPTLSHLLEALERRLAQPAEATLAAWRARDALLGREIEWTAGRGRARGIDGTGRLVVALADGGQTTLGAGEVHLQAVGERS
jgi:BirA family transcriptional regulator, biotin operon repressor / biotin---[acetyl-CoA-carboxylase] ligase